MRKNAMVNGLHKSLGGWEMKIAFLLFVSALLVGAGFLPVGPAHAVNGCNPQVQAC